MLKPACAVLVAGLAACADSGPSDTNNGNDSGSSRDAAAIRRDSSARGDKGSPLDAVRVTDSRSVDDAPALRDQGPLPDGGTPCGTQTCSRAAQVCVTKTPVGPATLYDCEPVPAGCADDRSCDCVAATVCTDVFDTCEPGSTDNVVICKCLDC